MKVALAEPVAHGVQTRSQAQSDLQSSLSRAGLSHPEAILKWLFCMFRCQQCGRVSAPGEKSCERILELRRCQHPLRINANRVRRVSPKGVSRVKLVDDPGGIGTAIAKRWIVCTACHSAAVTLIEHATLAAACQMENAVYQVETRRRLEEECSRKKGHRRGDD